MHNGFAGYISPTYNVYMGIKYSCNERFFDTWSPEMAYLLGYIYADGSLEIAPKMRGKYLRIGSTDKDRIVVAKALLNSEHTIVKEERPGKRKKFYLLRIGSHYICHRLLQIGLTPNKSLTMQFPKNIPSDLMHHFVRGYFDGDGCIYFEQAFGLTGTKIVKSLRVIFTSGSHDFLKTLSDTLSERLQNPPRRVLAHGSSKAYQLRYPTRESIQLFGFMYGTTRQPLFMERKYDIFTQYFIRRPQKVNEQVKRILEYNHGPVAKWLTRRSAKPIFGGSIPPRASRQ